MVENYGKENIDNGQDGLINEDPIDGKDNDLDGLFDEDPSEEEITKIIDNNQIFIIPMVNPDGVEANTRKNCVPNHGSFGLKKEITSYGVNLNRNYGFKWFLYYFFPLRYNLFSNANDNSLNYLGPYQFSENETKAVKNFVKSQNIKISISYHSYSEIIFYPWMHTSASTPDEKLFVSIGENISKINGYYLYKGRLKIPIPGGTIGTSENLLYGEEKIISYTLELCKSYAPTDPKIVLDNCIKHVGVNMYVYEIASNIKILIK